MTLRNLTLRCQRHRGDRILDHSKSKLYFRLNGLLYEKNYIDETLESFFSFSDDISFCARERLLQKFEELFCVNKT